jgi:NAD(P) transhydrogenase
MSLTAPSQADAYDLVAIGGGPAGESATELAAFFGYRCLIVEQASPGGTVTSTGGVPTKTLREAALHYSGFRDRDVYGLRLEAPPELALEEIRKRTWDVCERLQRATAAAIETRGVAYLRGRGRLAPGRRVAIEIADGSERTVGARVILLATGSRPAPPGPELPVGHRGLCDTDTILKRGHPPRRLLIVGGGPVSVEFATIAVALGSQVTIVSRGDRLLTAMDGELSSRLHDLMTGWGVKFVPGATVRAAIPEGEDLLDVTLTTGEQLSVDTVLFAAGRISNTEDLGVEVAGVALERKGRIAVDSGFRTTAEGVYAAGDVIGPTLASVAMEQARAAVCDAFGIPVRDAIDRAPVSAVYGMPELARAGLTEEECAERGLAYEVGRADLAETPRGAIAGRGGLLKLIFLEDSHELVGVHCLGDIASEVVGIGQMAIRCGATIHAFTTMALNTPTYSYAYKYAAFDGIRRLAAQGIQPPPAVTRFEDLGGFR